MDKDGASVLVLTWTFDDITVGDAMEKIHYSVVIGKKGDELNDIPLTTTNLLNTVRIIATHDNRIPSLINGNYAESGVAIARGQATSFA